MRPLGPHGSGDDDGSGKCEQGKLHGSQGTTRRGSGLTTDGIRIHPGAEGGMRVAEGDEVGR